MVRPAVLLIVVLVATACATEASDEVGAFSDIAVADPEIVFDPSGTVATLNVTTNIDAVCAVSYGTDGPSGSIATDQDMGAGGHADHSAVMTGLQPETTYQYRLQGVAADGRLYRSEVLTFTTPPVDPALSQFGDNLAVGATVVEVSSEFSDVFAAANAVDGDMGTEWSTSGDGDDAFLTVDLGRPVEVSAVGFRTRSMGDGSATAETFSVVADGESYGPFPVTDDPVAVDFTAQVVTFQVDDSTGGNTGAAEVQVFGS